MKFARLALVALTLAAGAACSSSVTAPSEDTSLNQGTYGPIGNQGTYGPIGNQGTYGPTGVALNQGTYGPTGVQ